MRVYIAGPMRGYEQFNYPAFDEAERNWAANGHTVITPPNLDRALRYEDHQFNDPSVLASVIIADLLAIQHCDAIVLLPGWEQSRGTAVELAFAKFLGKPVYLAHEFPTVPLESVA